MIESSCEPDFRQQERQKEPAKDAEPNQSGGNSSLQGRTFSEALKSKRTSIQQAHGGNQEPKWSVRKFICEIKISDVLVAVFAYLTIGVGLLQIYFLKGTLDATADNAEAAKQSAEALKGSERAYVFVAVVPLTGQNDMLLGARNGVAIRLVNDGKTPAILKTILSTAKAGAQPIDRMPDEAHVREFPQAWVVRSGGTSNQPRTVDIPVSDAEAVRTGKKVLYCMGIVEYEDIFKTKRETGYCWQYIPDRHIFKPSDSKLNYHT